MGFKADFLRGFAMNEASVHEEEYWCQPSTGGSRQVAMVFAPPDEEHALDLASSSFFSPFLLSLHQEVMLISGYAGDIIRHESARPQWRRAEKLCHDVYQLPGIFIHLVFMLNFFLGIIS